MPNRLEGYLKVLSHIHVIRLCSVTGGNIGYLRHRERVVLSMIAENDLVIDIVTV